MQSERMKLIPLLLTLGMLAVSGMAEHKIPEPYSAELVKRAEAGDAVAQWSLGSCYQYGNGVKINKEVSFGWYMKSAEQGNAEAQYELAEYYRKEGSELWKDDARIGEFIEMRKEYLLKAAEGGCSAAQRTIAHDYFYNRHSKGVERIKDLEEAKKWYTKAAVWEMVEQCEYSIKKEQLRLIKK